MSAYLTNNCLLSQKAQLLKIEMLSHQCVDNHKHGFKYEEMLGGKNQLQVQRCARISPIQIQPISAYSAPKRL